MSQLQTHIHEKGTLFAGKHTPTLDLSVGGQFGYAPRYHEWLNNQAYIRRNARAYLLSPPKLFQSLTNGAEWVRQLKALIEVHPRDIAGFDFGLTVNVATHDVGAGGQQQQEPVKTVRATSEPVFSYQSRAGRPEQRLFKSWIEMILDPNTTYSSALYRSDITGLSRTDIDSGKFFADQYAATILVFEPNHSFTHVEKACIVHNFYPLTTGPIVMESHPVDDLQLEELQINFAGIIDPCEGAIDLAMELLTETRANILGANPCSVKRSYPGRDTIVSESDRSNGSKQGVGFRYQVDNVKTEQLGASVA
jgi:hypothetical protein